MADFQHKIQGETLLKMTEFECKVLEILNKLDSKISAMNSEFSISRVTYFENLASGAIVGVDYVAFRFNCTESAVIRGRFRTNEIPRLRNKPLAFIKREVDLVWQNLNKPISEKAAELRKKATDRKRRKKGSG